MLSADVASARGRPARLLSMVESSVLGRTKRAGPSPTELIEGNVRGGPTSGVRGPMIEDNVPGRTKRAGPPHRMIEGNVRGRSASGVRGPMIEGNVRGGGPVVARAACRRAGGLSSRGRPVVARAACRRAGGLASARAACRPRGRPVVGAASGGSRSRAMFRGQGGWRASRARCAASLRGLAARNDRGGSGGRKGRRPCLAPALDDSGQCFFRGVPGSWLCFAGFAWAASLAFARLGSSLQAVGGHAEEADSALGY